ncbi:MAG: aspartate carbamoyltransferase [Candidatus Dasytiphilus stammeri]
MKNSLYLQHIISMQDFDTEKIQLVLEITAYFKLHNNPSDLLRNKSIAVCFFETSTRTRLSFESAMHRLGGSVIGFSDSSNTSFYGKEESLADTIKVISSYVNAIIIRHPEEGAALLASNVSGAVPIINAGDGSNQHPTQTLLDLFTIFETQKRLCNLNIGMVGDLKYGRTIHSLAQALSQYKGNRFFLLSTPSLKMPQHIINWFNEKRIQWSYHTNLKEVLDKLDILYMTRIQKERLNPLESTLFYNQVPYTLCAKDLIKVRSNLKILHPLPRLTEICIDVDKTDYAWYFQQASNGLYTRQAILALVLNKDLYL